LKPIDYLYRGIARYPDNIALEGSGARLTYRALGARVDALAAALQDTLPAGARIATCAHNNVEHVLSILAIFASGNTWIPLNPRNGRAELDAILELTTPHLIIADEDCFDRFSPGSARVIAGDTDSATSARETLSGLLVRYAGKRPDQRAATLDDTQIIKFTGGSTGRPKGVMQTHRTVNTYVAALLDVFKYDQHDSNLIATPLTHAASCFLLPILATGGRHVLADSSSPGVVAETLRSAQITNVFMPPTLIYSLMAQHAGARVSLPFLRNLIYGAAPMPAEKVRAARDFFGPVIATLYGQVEAPLTITAQTAAEFDNAENLASVGRATGAAQVGIMDRAGNRLPAGDLGEVVARGDLLMRGYYEQPELTASTIVDAWLHTGDVGVIDERGYLYLKDRIKDMIISGGFNVYPAEVESVLCTHAAIHECCVFGMPDERWGEAVHAAVQLRTGDTSTEQELIRYVKERLDSVKAPKRIHFVEHLPKSAVGKVLRRELPALLAQAAS
jgi:fatty-acyl-CoA synthase